MEKQKEEKYEIKIRAPKRLDGITKELLNDLANALWCFPDEIEVKIRLLDTSKEESEQ